MGNSRKSIKNSAGFSVVEVLVAFGLLSIIAVAIGAIINNSMQQQRGIQAKDQQREITAEIRSVLGVLGACLKTFDLVDPTASPTVAVIKDDLDATRFQVNTNDKTGLLRFEEFKLVRYIADAIPNQGQVDLEVKLSKVGSTGSAKDLKPDPISLKVKIVGGTVSECYALASAGGGGGGGGTNFWLPGTVDPTKIFYSAGNVGIGEGDPDVKLVIKDSSTNVLLALRNPGAAAPLRFPLLQIYNHMGPTNSGYPGINLINSRGVDTAKASILTSDMLGSITYWTTFSAGGGITPTVSLEAEAVENHAWMNYGTEFSISTVRVGNQALARRFFILGDGNFRLGSGLDPANLAVHGVISANIDDTYSLGTPALRFTTIYATNSIISTSDAREKKEITNSDLGLNFVNELRPVSYRWQTGTDNVIHYGLLAQETKTALKKAKQNTDAALSIVTYDAKSDRFGLRYSELIAPIIKAIQQLYAMWLENDNRVKALELENKAMKNYLCVTDPSAPFCR